MLPQTSHSLDQMHAGGYSVVVDASKYFHLFLIHLDDYPYLGLKHTVTYVLYEYLCLPKGSASSPGTACKDSLAFVQMFRE